MKKYTIRYQYGTYSGTEHVTMNDDADSEDAIRKMWKRLKPMMTLPMAYQSATVENGGRVGMEQDP